MEILLELLLLGVKLLLVFALSAVAVGSVILSIAALLYPVVTINQYCSHASKSDVKMEYKDFINLYHLNKDRWDYCDKNSTIFYNSNSIHGTNSIKFNFIDWLRVCHFFKSELKRAIKTNNLTTQKENLELILNSVQKDIDRIRKQSEEEIDKARETTYSAIGLFKKTVLNEKEINNGRT